MGAGTRPPWSSSDASAALSGGTPFIVSGSTTERIRSAKDGCMGSSSLGWRFRSSRKAELTPRKRGESVRRSDNGRYGRYGRVRGRSYHQCVSVAYEDLFDIEKRPGAGVSLWTKAVSLQLERVREANRHHRLHHSPNEDEKREDADAEQQLHADVYFLALAVRRVLLFHDTLAKQVDDARLREAREKFTAAAPKTREFRNFYEHLDQYLLDDPDKHVNIPGRVAPVLLSRWDCDNVVATYGSLRMDVTLAAVAAIELGKASEVVWNEHLDRLKREQPEEDPPPTDGSIPSKLEVTMGVSTVIGGDDEFAQIHMGVLFGTRVGEATAEEIA